MVVLTDPIADFIIRLKNASMADLSRIEIPHSSVKERVAKKLAERGYIKNVEVKGEGITRRILTTVSRDKKGVSIIKGVKRVSKPSRRVYVRARDLYPYKNGYGSAVLSTPVGILTDTEAKKHHIGGEILFYIW